MPGKYMFRTQADEDYGKLNVHLPTKYKGPAMYCLLRTIKTLFGKNRCLILWYTLPCCNQANYSMLVIVDANGDGKWTTGDLLKRKQPEMVIPYKNSVLLEGRLGKHHRL